MKDQKDYDTKVCTVQDLIDHLTKNFKPTDKLCMWYEGGAYMNCEHLLKYQLGDTRFLYVKDDKTRFEDENIKKPLDIYGDQHWINDNDVVIV